MVKTMEINTKLEFITHNARTLRKPASIVSNFISIRKNTIQNVPVELLKDFTNMIINLIQLYVILFSSIIVNQCFYHIIKSG